MQSMEHGTFLRLAGLLALYFIGYLWLVPRLAVILTLAIDPQAELINTYVLSCLYAVIIVLSLLLTKRQWKESLQKILKKPVSSVFKILFGAVCVLLLNVVLSMICSMLSGQVNIPRLFLVGHDQRPGFRCDSCHGFDNCRQLV